MSENELVVKEEGVILPDVKGTVAAMEAFEQLKTQVLKDQDKATINGKETITRSGFSKIALAFNLTTEIKFIEREDKDGVYTVYVTAMARNKYGRFAEANSSCSSSEWAANETKPDRFVIEGTAGTRATNRAIANLVGGGILSKEEMTGKPINKAVPVAPGANTGPSDTNAPASEKQIKFIEGLAGKAFGKEKQLNELTNILAQKCNGHMLGELNQGEAHIVIEYLKTLPAHA